jgi:hypothetical protein
MILFHKFGNIRKLDMASSVPSGQSRWKNPDHLIEPAQAAPAP